MATSARGPITAIIGVVALAASVLAGVGLGNYTVAGTSSFYSENYRATAQRGGMTAAAFWDSQGVSRSATHADPLAH